MSQSRVMRRQNRFKGDFEVSHWVKIFMRGELGPSGVVF